MIFRLMGRCNNHCRFCMVEEELRQKQEPKLDDIIRSIGETPAGANVDLFGGEPTLHPGFWKILDAAVDHGHSVTLATNARFFASSGSARRVSDMGNVSVRSSLLGPDAKTHDRLTRVVGSFNETLDGLDALVAERVPLLVNTVLCAQNTDNAKDTVTLLGKHGVRRVKLSGLITRTEMPELFPGLAQMGKAVLESWNVANGFGVTLQLEKMPLCVVPSLITRHIPETDPAMRRSEWFCYTAECKRCRVRPACLGLARGSIQAHHEREVRPFATLPRDATKVLRLDQLADYKPVCLCELIVLDLQREVLGEETIVNVVEAEYKLSKKFPSARIVEVRA